MLRAVTYKSGFPRLIMASTSSRKSINPRLHCTQPSPSRTTSSFSALVEEVRNGKQQIEVAYSTNMHWPFPRSIADKSLKQKNRLSIHILDSSFNPPTKAHLALARAHDTEHNAEDEYSANILLLSISNADKKLAPSDATYIQRLEMMVLMANTLSTTRPDTSGGVAIVVVNEPLFAQKQKLLSSLLPAIISEFTGQVDLVWQVGLDTLQRLFDTKYYGEDESNMRRVLEDFLRKPSAAGYGAKLLCARRQMSGTDLDPAKIPGAGAFFESGRIKVVEIGGSESTLSSTNVRRGVQDNDENWRQSCEPSVQEYITRENLYRSVVMNRS
jgi:nicotinamide-nucleotide adenylyltransferase